MYKRQDVDYTVYKNTLVNRAIEGTEYEVLKDTLAAVSYTHLMLGRRIQTVL